MKTISSFNTSYIVSYNYNNHNHNLHIQTSDTFIPNSFFFCYNRFYVWNIYSMLLLLLLLLFDDDHDCCCYRCLIRILFEF